MLRAEFHCHTTYSGDGMMTPAKLIRACREKGIDRVVVTDHNQVGGAFEAQAIDPGRVIVGEEIMTTRGEILAAFVKERVPARLSPRGTIEALRRQDAFIGVSHPFDLRRQGAWALPDLLDILPFVDAIETDNARCLDDRPNALARAFAAEHGLAGTAGSDAHLAWELGRGVMLLPEFDDPASLKSALALAKVELRISPAWVHVVTSLWKIARKQLAVSD